METKLKSDRATIGPPQAEPGSLLRKLGKSVTDPAQERRLESVETLKFAFHPWADLNNRAVHGVNFGMGGEYATLPRMALIYLPTLEVPKLKPKNNGFSVGKVTQYGVSPSAAVGSDVEIRLQFPSQTAEKLSRKFGERGLVILESLTAETPEEKEESVLLFEGVMNTVLGEDALKGAEVIMEDLPAWLAIEAPKLLEAALRDGVRYDDELYRLRPSARRKGEQMIQEIRQSVATGRTAALVVLQRTKKQLSAAKSGINDSKAMPDELDEFLLRQNPSFSLDSEVERASRANEGITAAIRESSSDTTALLQQIAEQNRLLTEQNGLLMARSKSPQSQQAA